MKLLSLDIILTLALSLCGSSVQSRRLGQQRQMNPDLEDYAVMGGGLAAMMVTALQESGRKKRARAMACATARAVTVTMPSTSFSSKSDAKSMPGPPARAC